MEDQHANGQSNGHPSGMPDTPLVPQVYHDVAVVAQQFAEQKAEQEKEREKATKKEEETKKEKDKLEKELLDVETELGQRKRDGEQADAEIARMNERIMDRARKTAVREEDLRSQRRWGKFWTGVAGALFFAAGLLYYFAFEFVYEGMSMFARIVGAVIVSLMVAVGFHFYAMRHYPLDENGEPRFSAALVRGLLILVVGSAALWAFAGHFYQQLLAEKLAGAVGGKDIALKLASVGWIVGIARMCVGVGVEVGAAVCFYVGISMIRASEASLSLYDEKRYWVNEQVDIDKDVIRLEKLRDYLQAKLNALPKS